MSATDLEVCIVGAGPRGLSVLERICADARQRAAGTSVTVHVVDPARPGAGAVWRTDQSRHLLMNTVASQVTLFTDASVELSGVLAPGPSLYEWARRIATAGDGALSHDEHRRYDLGRWDEPVVAEARELTADSYPTRALYGHYLEWVFRTVVREAPPQVRVRVHPLRAVDLCDEADGRQCLTLEDGSRLGALDAVVLAQGHLPVTADEGELRLARFARAHGLRHVRPANPADADLSAVAPGEPVALRGLGLNFFDHLALFTLGRGGAFERGADGTLVYRPSGREPTLYAASRRGVPYRSRGRNQKGAHGRHHSWLLTPAKLAELRRTADGPGLDFARTLWPLIAKEVETVHHAALLTRRAGAHTARRFEAATLAQPWGSAAEADVLDRFGIGPEERWDWKRIARPHGDRAFRSVGDYRSWLLEALRRDLAEAAEGNVDGPVKAALDVLRDLRNEIRVVVDHGGLTGRSHREDLDGWYTPLNAFLSIGPPPERIEQMTALVEAGVLHVLGPGMRVHTDERAGAFVVESPEVPGSRTEVTTLVEARLPEPDLRRTADPLLRALAAAGQCQPYVVRAGADEHGAQGSGGHETGGLAVTGRPYRLIAADGTVHPRRFAYGVPTEAVHWVTAAGVRPGVNSVTLGDSDAIALAVLDLARPAAGRRVPAGAPEAVAAPAAVPAVLPAAVPAAVPAVPAAVAAVVTGPEPAGRRAVPVPAPAAGVRRSA